MDKMKIIERKPAAALGLQRYFTGRACKHGHVSERYVSTGACVGCNAGGYARRIASYIERYGEDEGRRLFLEQRATESRIVREKKGIEHTEYIRNYMIEYRKTDEGALNCAAARLRYRKKLKAKTEEE